MSAKARPSAENSAHAAPAPAGEAGEIVRDIYAGVDRHLVDWVRSHVEPSGEPGELVRLIVQPAPGLSFYAFYLLYYVLATCFVVGAAFLIKHFPAMLPFGLAGYVTKHSVMACAAPCYGYAMWLLYASYRRYVQSVYVLTTARVFGFEWAGRAPRGAPSIVRYDRMAGVLPEFDTSNYGDILYNEVVEISSGKKTADEYPRCAVRPHMMCYIRDANEVARVMRLAVAERKGRTKASVREIALGAASAR